MKPLLLTFTPISHRKFQIVDKFTKTRPRMNLRRIARLEEDLFVALA